MNEVPQLVVVVMTYEGPDARRTEYAIRTAVNLREKLVWPEPVQWIVADDGSSDAHQKVVLDAVRDPGRPASHELADVGLTDAERGGYGASMNLAREACLRVGGRDHLALIVEDDWELRRPLDLQPFAGLLHDRPDVGCIRLGYIGYTQPLVGEFIPDEDGHQWLLLHRSSPEGYVFAGHPRLEHSDFWDEWRWPRVMRPGDTEGLAAKYYRERSPGPRREIVWPVDFQPASQRDSSYFGHIGQLQSMDYD